VGEDPAGLSDWHFLRDCAGAETQAQSVVEIVFVPTLAWQ
jgi:hypothetical protein